MKLKYWVFCFELFLCFYWLEGKQLFKVFAAVDYASVCDCMLGEKSLLAFDMCNSERSSEKWPCWGQTECHGSWFKLFVPFALFWWPWRPSPVSAPVRAALWAAHVPRVASRWVWDKRSCEAAPGSCSSTLSCQALSTHSWPFVCSLWVTGALPSPRRDCTRWLIWAAIPAWAKDPPLGTLLSSALFSFALPRLVLRCSLG